jgi:hypothetical protein
VLGLTGGNAHDITQADSLAAQVEPEALLGDKGYDADSFITSFEVRAIKAVIPPKSTRTAQNCRAPRVPKNACSLVSIRSNYSFRWTIFNRSSEIASPGFKPFGQAFAQFRIV